MSAINTNTEGAVGTLLEALSHLKVHDVSSTIESDMPMWFIHEQPVITPKVRHDQGGVAINSLSFNEHTGTHTHAPFHFDPHSESEQDAIFSGNVRRLLGSCLPESES